MSVPVPGPGEAIETFSLTDESKARITRVCSALVDWLKKNTETPLEAFMVLDLVKGGLADTFNIKASAFIPKGGAQA